MREQPVMIDPHDQDRGEAGEKRQIDGPLMRQRLKQVTGWRDVVRNLDVEDEECHSYSEHPIAERFDPGRVAVVRHHTAFDSFIANSSLKEYCGRQSERAERTESGSRSSIPTSTSATIRPPTGPRRSPPPRTAPSRRM